MFILLTMLAFVSCTDGSGWAAPVSAENAVGLVVALLLTVFLVLALLFPERF